MSKIELHITNPLYNVYIYEKFKIIKYLNNFKKKLITRHTYKSEMYRGPIVNFTKKKKKFVY